LKIKEERFSDLVKLGNVRQELAMLQKARDEAIESSPQLQELTGQLKQVNTQLWEIEDALRLCERQKDFGSRFVELARAVYHYNDRRSELKRQINNLVGSILVEEKSYTSYGLP
jgi:chromosome segregation ATPase